MTCMILGCHRRFTVRVPKDKRCNLSFLFTDSGETQSLSMLVSTLLACLESVSLATRHSPQGKEAGPPFSPSISKQIQHVGKSAVTTAGSSSPMCPPDLPRDLLWGPTATCYCCSCVIELSEARCRLWRVRLGKGTFNSSDGKLRKAATSLFRRSRVRTANAVALLYTTSRLHSTCQGRAHPPHHSMTPVVQGNLPKIQRSGVYCASHLHPVRLPLPASPEG